MKHRLNTYLAVFATALLAALTPLQAAPPKKITVGHDLWIGYAGIFVAKDMGFFEKAGFDVEFKSFSNPGDTLPALIGGHLDIGLTTLQNLALINSKTGGQVAAVYLVDSSNGADAIVARSEIKSLKDLKGKKVAATLGEVNHFLLLAGLEKAGLKEADIKLVDMSADDAGAAFIAGKLDAAVTWEPWVTKARASGGKVLFSSAEVPDTILDCVALKKKTLEANGVDIRSFLAAIDEGVKFVRENPGQAHQIIARYLGAKPEEVKDMLLADKVYSLQDNAKLLGSGGKGFASMKRVIDFAAAQKLLPKAVDADKQFEPKFVRP